MTDNVCISKWVCVCSVWCGMAQLLALTQARWWDSSSRYDKYYGKSGYDRYDDYSYDYDDVQPRADRATRDAILKWLGFGVTELLMLIGLTLIGV